MKTRMSLLFALCSGACAPADFHEAEPFVENNIGTAAVMQSLVSGEESTKDVQAVTWCTMRQHVDLIFAATVSDTYSYRCKTGSQQIPAICTQVKFSVETSIFDDNRMIRNDHISLHFIGGRIGNTSQVVSNSPHFAKSDKVILFINSKNPSIPTIGGTQGVLRIFQQKVLDHSGRPVVAISDQGLRFNDEPTPTERLPHPVGSASGGPVSAHSPDAMLASRLIAELTALLKEPCQ